MFSANQNIALREHKRRVVGFVESTIPDDALDLGTMVMAMEVTCKAPGCVPLETVITIVFPRGQKTELIPGLPESGSGGNYKTKILMPLAEVTKDDVLDALPPEFEGGRRTMESLCLRARDVMLGQIGQIMNEDDVEGRKLMAEYLMTCLKDYTARGCVAPDIGESFAPLESDTSSVNANSMQRGVSTSGNFVVRRRRDSESEIEEPKRPTGNSGEQDDGTYTSIPTNTSTGQRHPLPAQQKGNAMDWRRRNKMEVEVNAALQASSSSQSIVQKLSEREHAGGIRRPGCPCCDPDNPSNVVDQMMML